MIQKKHLLWGIPIVVFVTCYSIWGWAPALIITILGILMAWAFPTLERPL